MIYYLIEYKKIYPEIAKNVEKFCGKFDIDFDSQKLKTKRELLLYYSILTLLRNLKNGNIEKPIVVFDKSNNGNLFQYCFKKIQAILVIPIFYCEEFDNSEGLKTELSIKADCFYNKNIFTVKKLEKLLAGKNFQNLTEDIKNFKLLVTPQQKESIFV